MTGTICRNGPEGTSHKWCLSPFSQNPARSFSSTTRTSASLRLCARPCPIVLHPGILPPWSGPRPLAHFFLLKLSQAIAYNRLPEPKKEARHASNGGSQETCIVMAHPSSCWWGMVLCHRAPRRRMKLRSEVSRQVATVKRFMPMAVDAKNEGIDGEGTYCRRQSCWRQGPDPAARPSAATNEFTPRAPSAFRPPPSPFS